MQLEAQASNLLLTDRGKRWLAQFDEGDRPLARQLTEAISLVSVQELERVLNSMVEGVVGRVEGPIALYTAREVPRGGKLDFRRGGNGLDAVERGSDVGSEARVAHILRQLCRTQPGRLLRQPDIETLLQNKVRHVVAVDDFIGSGDRARSYLDQIWHDPTVKSWWSYGKIRFTFLAYAGTAEGVRKVGWHPCKPAVHVHRYCPSLDMLPWRLEHRRNANKLCTRYARRFNLKGWPLGYGEASALLVFEHGVPNNVPNIYWADSNVKGSEWVPLFPGRAATAELASVFPAELASRTPVSVLLDVGATRMAEAMPSVMHRPYDPQTIVALSLIRRGVNRVEAISEVTGLTAKDGALLLERCIEAGLVSPRRRLTDKGAAELASMCAAAPAEGYRKLPVGEDSYYPQSLRGRIAG